MSELNDLPGNPRTGGNYSTLERSSKSAPSFELHFSDTNPPLLEEIHFSHPLLLERTRTVRGNSPGALGNAGTFRWSSAVQGLTLLLLHHAIHDPNTPPFLLRGEKGTLAASLDYALTKAPMWLLDVFGTDSTGMCLARKIFKRTNSERKRGGEVIIAVGEAIDARRVVVRRSSTTLDTPGIVKLIGGIAEFAGSTPPTTLCGSHRLSSRESSLDVAGDPQTHMTERQLSSHGLTPGAWNEEPNFLEHPEYFKCFCPGRPLSDSLSKVRELFGEHLNGQRISIESSTNIRVFNPGGDARITNSFLVANAGFTDIREVFDYLWLEYPRSTVDTSVSDDSGAALPWSYSENTLHAKQVRIVLARPILPLETFTFRVSHFVPGLYRSSQFHFVKILPGLLTKRLRIDLEYPNSAEIEVLRLSRSANQEVAEQMPVEIERGDGRVSVSWQADRPESGTVIKTYWSLTPNAARSFS